MQTLTLGEHIPVLSINAQHEFCGHRYTYNYGYKEPSPHIPSFDLPKCVWFTYVVFIFVLTCVP
jgi:hypothetical protein